MQIIADKYIPEFEDKIVRKQERKWARRIMYQRWRRFDCTVKRERVIICFGGVFYAHPNTIEVIKQQLKEKGIV